MDHVSRYFSDLTKEAQKTKTDGLPTPKNPFILGYGISQVLKKLSEIDSKLSKDKTPRYFIPSSFGLAASKNPSALMFGLLSFRGKPEDQRNIRADDTNAGKPKVYYFDVVRVDPVAHDELMVISKGVFFDLFAKGALVNALWTRPSVAFEKLLG